MAHHEDGELSKAPVSWPSLGKKPSGELTKEEIAAIRQKFAQPDVMIPSGSEGKTESLRELIEASLSMVISGLIPQGWAEEVGPDVEGEAELYRSARLRVSVKLLVQEREELGPNVERMADVGLKLPERYVKYLEAEQRRIMERRAGPSADPVAQPG